MAGAGGSAGRRRALQAEIFCNFPAQSATCEQASPSRRNADIRRFLTCLSTPACTVRLLRVRVPLLARAFLQVRVSLRVRTSLQVPPSKHKPSSDDMQFSIHGLLVKYGYFSDNELEPPNISAPQSLPASPSRSAPMTAPCCSLPVAAPHPTALSLGRPVPSPRNVF